jgi:hypothetical protein
MGFRLKHKSKPAQPPPARLIDVVLDRSFAGSQVDLQDVTGWRRATVEANGIATFPEVTAGLSNSAIRVLAEGYWPYEESIVLFPGSQQIRIGVPADPSRLHDVILHGLKSFALPEPPALSTAGESGLVHVDGLVFRREDGSIFQWNGFSDFRLFELFLKNEDIQPLLTERIALGANVLRVFGMYKQDEHGNGIGNFRPQDHADYYTKLTQFVALLASRGLRLEFVVFADGQRVMPDQAEQETHLEKVYQALV